MNKKKTMAYRVVCWSYAGKNEDGIAVYLPKWVCLWPDDAREWGARFDVTPTAAEAKEFGRDKALEIAQTIRLRAGLWAMVERA